jgi:hypothetical protein
MEILKPEKKTLNELVILDWFNLEKIEFYFI